MGIPRATKEQVAKEKKDLLKLDVSFPDGLLDVVAEDLATLNAYFDNIEASVIASAFRLSVRLQIELDRLKVGDYQQIVLEGRNFSQTDIEQIIAYLETEELVARRRRWIFRWKAYYRLVWEPRASAFRIRRTFPPYPRHP